MHSLKIFFSLLQKTEPGNFGNFTSQKNNSTVCHDNKNDIYFCHNVKIIIIVSSEKVSGIHEKSTNLGIPGFKATQILDLKVLLRGCQVRFQECVY